jgi:hypothetical protein
MSQKCETIRQSLIKAEYEPIGSSRKITLLLQRSVRYSYRQRCCNCCPTILCELLFPLVIIILLGLSRYGINRLGELVNQDGSGAASGPFNERPCSQNLSIPATSSNDIFKNCFQFPPSYTGGAWNSGQPEPVSNQTNIVFEPARSDVDELVLLAKARLITINCNGTQVQ